MSEQSDHFLQWVSDPRRTNDELLTVELILEAARNHEWPHHHVELTWDARAARGRERKLNPAHRPALHLDELRTLAERVDKMTYFAGSGGDERPLRDLSALRFFPHWQHLGIQPSDVTDLTPLASLREVTYFSIAEYGELYGCHPICLAQCGPMPNLEHLHLALRHPWPDLRALADWPKLNFVSYNGSVLAWEDVECLPAANQVLIKAWVGNHSFFRDLRRLPLMPVVKELTLEDVATLDGIERFPSVLNLTLNGCYRDLSPLAQMENITSLILVGEYFHDLRPLAQMKNLREITFQRQWPLDIGPLADCRQLRIVTYERCPIMQTEVAALNAVLLPEANDFLAPTPRPLRPLKFYRYAQNSPAAAMNGKRVRKKDEERIASFRGDAARMRAQERAFCRTLQEKLDQFLGKGWGFFEQHFTRLKRYQDTARLREVIEIIREYQASLLYPPRVCLIVEPHGDIQEEMDEIREREKENEPLPDEHYFLKYTEEKTVLEENAEHRRRLEEHYEVMKREHFLEQGGEEAALILGIPHEEPEEEEEELAEEESLGEEGEGGVAIAPPPPPPPDRETTDLEEELMFYLDVSEDCASTHDGWVAPAEYSLGVKFEELQLDSFDD